MISKKKAAELERGYRALLYGRPIGIFSVLMLACVSAFSIGIALSSTHFRFPFFTIYVSLFALLILAISIHWLIHAVALLKKKDWSGVILACLGFGGSWLSIVLLVQAVAEYPNR